MRDALGRPWDQLRQGVPCHLLCASSVSPLSVVFSSLMLLCSVVDDDELAMGAGAACCCGGRSSKNIYRSWSLSKRQGPSRVVGGCGGEEDDASAVLLSQPRAPSMSRRNPRTRDIRHQDLATDAQSMVFYSPKRCLFIDR